MLAKRAAAAITVGLVAGVWVPAPRAGGDKGGISWETSVSRAKEKAKARGVPIVVDFWASWCGWCRVQDREIFDKPEMIEYSKGQVYLKLNTEDRGQGERLARALGVTSLPTILVMDSQGKELDRIEGYLPLDPFMKKLKEIAEGKGELQLLSKKPNPTSRELLKLAYLYLERNDADGATQAFERILQRDSGNREGFTDEALYYLGKLALTNGELETAKRHFRTYLQRYPDEDMAQSVKAMLEIIEG